MPSIWRAKEFIRGKVIGHWTLMPKATEKKKSIEKYENNLNQKILKATRVWRSFTQKERDENGHEIWESNMNKYSMESEDEEVNNAGMVEESSEGKDTDEKCGIDILEETGIADGSVRISDGDSDSHSDDSYDYHDNQQERRPIYMDEGEEEELPEFLYWLGYPPCGERTCSEWYDGTTSQNVGSDGKAVNRIKRKFLFSKY